MLTGIHRSAEFTHGGAYRVTLTRTWLKNLPVLLVVLFNPSDASHLIDDPTVTLLCHIAAHNGFGGIVVVNGIPLVSSAPGAAAYMVNTWEKRSAWDERDRLQDNIATIRAEVARAGAVLVAWGALASRCPAWFEHVIEQIREELPVASELYCLGKTAGGFPKHPMARGKHKVPKNALLLPWTW